MAVEVFAAVAIAAAFFLQRITGFGSAILATPVLALFWSPHESIAFTLIFQSAFGIWLIWRTWRRLRDGNLRFFLVVFIPAVLAGSYLLPGFSEELLRKAMALVTGLVLVQWLLLPSFELPQRWRNAAGACAGLVSGLTQGILGMGGPFFLAYYGAVEKRSELIRDASIAVFFIANVLRPPVALATAQFTISVLTAAAIAALPFAAAMLAGRLMSERVSETLFRYLVVGILAVATVSLILR